MILSNPSRALLLFLSIWSTSVVSMLAFAQPVEFEPSDVSRDGTRSDAMALDWEAVRGTWKTAYWDSELGGVAGEAVVEEGAVTLKLRDPEGGAERTLEAESAVIEGDELVMIFGSGFPEGGRETGLGYPEEVVVFETPRLGQLEITGGVENLVVPVAPFEPTDIGKVEVRLTRAAPGALIGEWRYRVHPFIGRAEDGRGRAGHVEQDENGAWWAIGGESWRRPRPQVYGAVPIQDQLAMEMFSDGTSMAHYGYPFGASAVGTGRQRTIFVFGRDLPRDWSQRRVEVEAGTPGISYTEIARLSNFQDREDRRETYDRATARRDREMDDFIRGRRIVKNRLDPAERNNVDELDAVILRADLSEDVVPGWQSFEYASAEGAWLLQFGDNIARLRVVRKIGRQNEEHEQAVFLFSGEMFRIEIETAHALPVESIPVVVGAAPPGAQLDEWQEGGLLLGDGEGIPAFRIQADPRIYRTDFIRVDPRLPPGKVIEASMGTPFHSVAAGQGARVFASIGKAGVISLPTAMAQATVYDTTGDTGVGGDWTRWLEQAASCAGLANVDRIRTERAHAETISEFLINSGRARFPIPGWVESKVTVGQHAGMLILRDTFVRQLERNRASFAGLESDQEILAFRRAMEPVIRQGRSPLTRIEVTGIDGGPVTFDWTFEKSIIGDVHDKELEDVERWAVSATREVLVKYTTLMAEQSRRARAIDDCDVEALIKLTGYEFETVAALARSKLMLRAPAPLYWAPDYRARGHVETVAYVADTVAVNERLAESDRREALMAVGLATIPVAIVGGAVGSSAAIIATLAVDVIDVGYATYAEVSEKWARDAELQFALAAADVTGMRRLERAEARTRDWSAVMGALFPQVTFAAIGILVDVPDLYRAFGEGLRLTRVARGRKAVMAANGIVEAAEQAPVRAAQVSEELEEALDRVRAAQAAGEAPDGPALREFAGDELDPEIADALDAPTPGVRFDDLPDSLDDTADDIFAYLDDIDGSDIRSQLDDAVLAEMDRIAGRIDEANPPDWAGSLQPETFDFVRGLINPRRTDLMDLMESGAARVAAQLDAGDPVRRRFAREVLESEPGITVDRFEEIVENLVSRRPEPRGRDYFTQADPGRAELNEALENAGWRFELEEQGDTAGLLVRDPDGRAGNVQRAFDPDTGNFTMEQAFRDARLPSSEAVPGPIRGMIEGVLPVPLASRGVPAIQYATMRLMNHMGVRYGKAAGEGAIRLATMEHIANFATIVKLEFLRRAYHPGTALLDIPPEELSRLLMMTHSVRYAQSVLASAGYRVTGARIELDSMGDLVGEGAVGGWRRNFHSATETAEEFAARHGLEMGDEARSFFNIVLDVEPF